MWAKPGKGDQPKLGYAEMIPGTSYWIGTGVYIDNIEEARGLISDTIDTIVTRQTLTRTGIIAGVMLLAVLPLCILLIRSIVTPLRQSAEAAEAIAQGNLDVQLSPEGRDETAHMQRALDTMVHTLKQSIIKAETNENEAHELAEQARNAAQKAEDAMLQAKNATREGMLAAASRLEGVIQAIRHVSAEIADKSKEISGGTDMQLNRLNEAATAMDQMNATVIEVAKNASVTAEHTETTRDNATEGNELVFQTASAMNELQEITITLRDNMHRLGEQSESIGQVMMVINDIADQTNLLALNAAIEAARAGEAGRGFAVVADEVRKLAEKTMGATGEVGNNIQGIQQLARINVQGIDKAVESIRDASGISDESGRKLGDIVSLAEEAVTQIQSIATAAEEQSAASEQITRSVDEIHTIAQDNSSRVGECDTAIQELAEQATQLIRLVEELKTESE